MQKETTQELGCRQRHLIPLTIVGIVLPAEGDALSIECQQSMIGNGYAMGVAAKIAQHLQWTAESWFGIDHPVLAGQATNQLSELPGIGQRGGRANTL